MHQVLYFSETKSRQFMGHRKRRVSMKDVSAEISVPGINASLSATAEPDGTEASETETVLRRSSKVFKYLKKSALHYEDPDVSDGTWIQFETRLAQALVWVGNLRMLFFGPHPGSTGDIALLLYGNPNHLTTPPGIVAGVDVHDLDSSHDSLAAMIQAAAAESNESNLRGTAGFRDGVIKMAERAQQHSISFPRLFGYAQVVGTFDSTDRIFLSTEDDVRCPSQLVVASPLIVEYS
ncbi:SAVMC3_10250 family protein [Streptomyces sp. ME19-01-6]|uniref:SAVMC3_10250 family protein n=1 Tax=Streptomyces sp. ME19-01-6 TaxID=3028686 RepID=UPI0029AB93F3|nr:SAVMC3_10250 family protein [Streptomyces sp. ME19-01-6]MDX3225968.1 SAVMC3_10250 family protein [Streptomyces sp. ME19-01-6]